MLSVRSSKATFAPLRAAASAAELLERDEAIYMGYVVDETMRYAFPEDRFADLVGRDLTQFTYVFPRVLADAVRRTRSRRRTGASLGSGGGASSQRGSRSCTGAGNDRAFQKRPT